MEHDGLDPANPERRDRGCVDADVLARLCVGNRARDQFGDDGCCAGRLLAADSGEPRPALEGDHGDVEVLSTTQTAQFIDESGLESCDPSRGAAEQLLL